MAENLDATKVLLAIICNNEQERQHCISALRNVSVTLFPGLSKLDFVVTIKEGNLAATCNKVLKLNNAKWKVFLTSPVVAFDRFLISSVLSIFFTEPQRGIVGLLGSEMPLSGDYTQARNFYGSYFFRDPSGNIGSHIGKTPLFYKSVHMIDSGFFATSEDIPFDEEVGDDFFMAAQCCRYRQAGYNVMIAYSEVLKIVFAEDRCIYKNENTGENFQEQLKFFKTTYKNIVTPLVSVCIPTYNQPQFLKIALESALNQTYGNVEVIIGDDSTNEDTKKMMEDYLQRYDNIKYFYHKGPLGGKGARNTTFTINKASGNYINVLFHDDVIAPEKIYRAMEYFISDLENKIAMVTSARMQINEHGQVLGRMNSWQPINDEILSGEEVGRRILFSKNNFLGELSTSLLKKSSLLAKDPETGEEIFDIGIFCGVKDVAYGDIGTWLDVLKSGGSCVFLKDNLSAFRRHSAQNTDDLGIRTRLLIEAFNYTTIAWLNNIYLHNFDEYKFTCAVWVKFFDTYYIPAADNETAENIIVLRNTMKELRALIVSGKFAEALDCSIRFLLDVLPPNNSIRPLIRRNRKTGLWEKANDGIMLYGEQRC